MLLIVRYTIVNSVVLSSFTSVLRVDIANNNMPAYSTHWALAIIGLRALRGETIRKALLTRVGLE